LCAIARQQPDRTPRDFWAEEPTWTRLLSATGSQTREAILRQLGIDVRHIDARTPSERPLGEGVFQNFWGERYTYKPTPWGPMRDDLPGALAGERAFSDLEGFPWPNPDDFDYAPLTAAVRDHADFGLLYGFADVWQRPALVRGWQDMFTDMIEHPDWLHFLCRRFTEFYLEDYTRAAEATRGRIDLYLLISDLGSQKGPLISMAMFREFVAPYIRAMTERIHTLGGKVLFHSCGAIRPFIPELIELGVDVLDPIQPLGLGMTPQALKADFGHRLCFHGGIDMQQLLPFAKPAKVRQAAREYCEVLGQGGGYILSPAHLFQPDVPPENILAMYEDAP
jgi:uroporphyrinogen decarboxylase